MVVGALADEECYRNVRRYSAGVIPVAHRNARVKLDCEENLGGLELRNPGTSHVFEMS
jgi:hypothetical protein